MSLSSYRPGTWFGVFGSATTLLLPASEKSRVAALWSRIDDGAEFEAVLDELLQSGLGTLPGFVLVSGGEEPTKLLVRGRVVVSGTAGGEQVRIDGTEALTWVERTLADVESLSILLDGLAPDEPDVAGEPDLPIIGGLVRVSRVDQPAVPIVQEAEVDAEPDDSRDDVRLDMPIDPPAMASTAAPVARLEISSGESIEVDRVVLIGRTPRAPLATGDDRPRLVTVPSPLHEISSTHVEVRPGSGVDQGSAVVTDLGSTNGTVVAQPGRGPENLRPGIAVQLLPGATINLGDGVSIRVTRG
ncbi:MAG: FHA domain-containing protein [Nocardioides sp.]